jgi:hypothetical protein
MFSLQRRIFCLAFCLAALSATVFADGTSVPDPIVDLEGGTGSNPYFGGQVFVTFTATQGNTNCFGTDFSAGNTPIVSCGTTGNFIRPGDPTQGGIFSNDTGMDITQIHVHIDTFFADGSFAGVSQGGFTEFAASGQPLFPGPQFVDEDGNGTTFTGGDVTGCPRGVEFCTPGEFKIGYAEVLIPEGGSAAIEFDQAPEPSTLVLLVGTLPVAWRMRRKLTRS